MDNCTANRHHILPDGASDDPVSTGLADLGAVLHTAFTSKPPAEKRGGAESGLWGDGAIGYSCPRCFQNLITQQLLCFNCNLKKCLENVHKHVSESLCVVETFL